MGWAIFVLAMIVEILVHIGIVTRRSDTRENPALARKAVTPRPVTVDEGTARTGQLLLLNYGLLMIYASAGVVALAVSSGHVHFGYVVLFAVTVLMNPLFWDGACKLFGRPAPFGLVAYWRSMKSWRGR